MAKIYRSYEQVWSKPNYRPRDRMVLDGKVKLTPRRLEILFHIACTDGVWWNREITWSDRWSRTKSFVPYLGETNIRTTLSYLIQRKLVRYSPEGGRPQ